MNAIPPSPCCGDVSALSVMLEWQRDWALRETL